MRLKIRKNTSERTVNRVTKKIRIRKTVKGTDVRPRLCVYRSGKHIYAQIINDNLGTTVITSSSLTIEKKVPGIEQAKQVGIAVAKAALAKNIKEVVFDRNGFIYHGRVKSLADGAREGGLNF